MALLFLEHLQHPGQWMLVREPGEQPQGLATQGHPGSHSVTWPLSHPGPTRVVLAS